MSSQTPGSVGSDTTLNHAVTSREEWLAARRELLIEEKDDFYNSKAISPWGKSGGL